jgi:hypothetical protein
MIERRFSLAVAPRRGGWPDSVRRTKDVQRIAGRGNSNNVAPLSK